MALIQEETPAQSLDQLCATRDSTRTRGLRGGFDLAAGTSATRPWLARCTTGQVCVLLHGFPQSWLMWRLVLPALTARHFVVAVDLRGYGDLDKRPSRFVEVGRPAGSIAWCPVGERW